MGCRGKPHGSEAGWIFVQNLDRAVPLVPQIQARIGVLYQREVLRIQTADLQYLVMAGFEFLGDLF